MKGVSQEGLEAESGVSQQHISLIESGKRELTTKVAGSLAPALGLEWAELYVSHNTAKILEGTPEVTPGGFPDLRGKDYADLTRIDAIAEEMQRFSMKGDAEISPLVKEMGTDVGGSLSVGVIEAMNEIRQRWADELKPNRAPLSEWSARIDATVAASPAPPESEAS